MHVEAPPLNAIADAPFVGAPAASNCAPLPDQRIADSWRVGAPDGPSPQRAVEPISPRLLAGAASLALHVALLGALAWRVVPLPDATAAVEVELVNESQAAEAPIAAPVPEAASPSEPSPRTLEPPATVAPIETPAATSEPTPAPTATLEPIPTAAAMSEPTPTPAASQEPTPTPAAMSEPTPTPTASPEPTPTPTPAAISEPTPTPAASQEPAPTPAATPEPKPRPTAIPTVTRLASSSRVKAPAESVAPPRRMAPVRPHAPVATGVAAAAADGIGPSLSAARADYGALVLAQIRAHKFYPAAALEAHESGDVGVLFVVASSGRIASVAITRSSGAATLDQAARTIIDAIELPPPPGGFYSGSTQLDFVAP